MWYEIMQEFNCKATSSWSSCDDEKEMAYTDKKRRERCEWTDVAVWITSWGTGWQRIRCTYITTSSCGVHGDHNLIYATIREDDAQHYHIQQKRKKRWTGWRPVDDEAKIEYKKTVMTKKEQSKKKTKRQYKRAMRRHTKEVSRTPQNERRSTSKMYTTDQEKGAQETVKERQSRSCCDM